MKICVEQCEKIALSSIRSKYKIFLETYFFNIAQMCLSFKKYKNSKNLGVVLKINISYSERLLEETTYVDCLI